MRRNEHELTDQERIDTLIGSCQVCRLGFVDGDRPYIVPLNFGYALDGGRRIFYFHGAREGRKMDLARRNGTAGFELDAALGRTAVLALTVEELAAKVRE